MQCKCLPIFSGALSRTVQSLRFNTLTGCILRTRALSNASQKATNEEARLQSIRNVGVFAHVDAGKTTVTERMLEAAGVVNRAGSVDDGDTVTDWYVSESTSHV